MKVRRRCSPIIESTVQLRSSSAITLYLIPSFLQGPAAGSSCGAEAVEELGALGTWIEERLVEFGAGKKLGRRRLGVEVGGGVSGNGCWNLLEPLIGLGG